MVSPSMDRRDAVERLLLDRGEALVVTGLGSPSYDVHAAGDHDSNFYLWGAMGSAALVSLGLSLAQPDRRVMAITGDGEQLMAMGSLATIGVAAPSNLEVFVLDNERYGETGMQASHTGRGVNLADAALACGFAEATTVINVEEVDDLVERRASESAVGPSLTVLKISDQSPPRSLPIRDGVYIKNRFRASLGLAPN